MIFDQKGAGGYKEQRSEGGIVLPNMAMSGEKEHADCIFGIVVRCGMAAERASIKPFESTQFPLEKGASIVVRKILAWKMPGTLTEWACNTWDVVQYCPPGVKPPWAEGETR